MLTKNYDLGNRVTAFSTMREGGVSTGNYASFNINHYCGDSEEHIARNLEILSERLDIPTENFIYPHQTHSKVVRGITQEFFALSKAEQKEYIEGVDALITDITGICIGVSTADCIPVLVYDPEHHCAAAIHAGWRGTVQRIVEEAVKAMSENYGSRPESLRAAIGPGISLQSFEVGDEVYSAFLDAQFPMDKTARHQMVTLNKRNGILTCPSATVCNCFPVVSLPQISSSQASVRIPTLHISFPQENSAWRQGASSQPSFYGKRRCD